jgi:cysteinyl-tRNA synthetase
MDIKLFNTLGREKQVFEPVKEHHAGLYTCGPTVYDYQHIGNFRTFLFEDFLKRVLVYNGYRVTHIMNITDVGHLVSDDDEGEDKMEKGSARTGKTVWEIADYYTKVFMEDAKLLNILPPTEYTRATDYIAEQVDMIECLDKKGYTYVTSDGVYFDTSKLNDYGKLAMLDIEGLEEGKRIEFSGEKRNKTDFALWKFSPKGEKRQMEWVSPWGKGFPGWHIECSAMSRKFLGDTFDIHCGGIDHVPIHHTNEIAQSESCTGKPMAHYWLHGAFLEEESGKMSKSTGEFLRLKVLIDKGYSPLDYRYLCLGTHYRKRLLFSWELLDQAKTAFDRLKQNILMMRQRTENKINGRDAGIPAGVRKEFKEAVNDDLNMPQALAVMWGVVRDEKLTDFEKLNLLYDFNSVLGLDLHKITEEKNDTEVPEEVMKLVNKRIEAKNAKDFKLADELRAKVKELGYDIVDKKEGAEVKKIKN